MIRMDQTDKVKVMKVIKGPNGSLCHEDLVGTKLQFRDPVFGRHIELLE